MPTISTLLAKRAREQPSRCFVRFDRGIQLSYTELDAAVSGIAAGLQGLGLQPGERVAIMLHNEPGYLQTWIALARIGLVEVPVSPALRGTLLAGQLRRSQARAIVTDAESLPLLMAVRDQLPDLDHVIITSGTGMDGAPDAAIHSLDRLRQTDISRLVPVEADDSQVSGIMFTSGTTGLPKGVVQPHSAGLQLARDTVELMDYGRDDVLYTAFPLIHVNAKYATVLAAMLADASVILHRRFRASDFWNICQAEGVTAFNFMGAVLMMLAKQAPGPADRKHRVRAALGALVPPGMHDLFRDRFGVGLVEVYGSTELGIAASTQKAGTPPGSFGKARPHFELEVHDETGQPCRPGVAGELVVRPRRQGVMFSEYHDMPEATLEAFEDLWFHTGDRVRADADGNLFFVDRLKDSIRRRGENISSWEVEQAIGLIDGVAEVAAIGVPSELSEEEVMVFIVLKPGSALQPFQVALHCSEHLPAYAVPRFVRFIDALPKNASQRVLKADLREVGVDEHAWDRTKHHD